MPLLGRDFLLSSQWKCFHSLNHQVAGEIRADQADHLMVVKSCYYFEMRAGVEDFVDLLEKRLSVELSGRDECIFSKKDVLSFQSSVEVLVEKI